VYVFEEGWGERARVLRPQAIACSLSQLDAIDVALTHALIVIGRISDLRLSEADHERLWSKFRVPVFEQIIGEECELLAAECEARDGLHIVSISAYQAAIDSYAMAAGRAAALEIAGNIDESPCACGRSSARLKIRGRSVAAST